MMISFLRRIAIICLSGLLSVGLAQADEGATHSPQLSASASYPGRANNTPDDGAIRRANPNSRQGTESISPTLRGPSLGPVQQRPPTLENGDIGNGYPSRQQSPRPSSGVERRSN
jgi:hypothetical protein